MQRKPSQLFGQTQASQRNSNSMTNRLNRSLQDLRIPYEHPALLKLPKNKRVRKSTEMHILIQSENYEPKASVRIFTNRNNRSSIFDVESQLSHYRRSKSPGLFHSLSLQSKKFSVQNRTIQDIGTAKNRKKPGLFKQIKNDPILIGDTEAVTGKYKLKTIHQQPRKTRDKGERMRSNLLWQKIKPKTYLERFRAARYLK